MKWRKFWEYKVLFVVELSLSDFFLSFSFLLPSVASEDEARFTTTALISRRPRYRSLSLSWVSLIKIRNNRRQSYRWRRRAREGLHVCTSRSVGCRVALLRDLRTLFAARLYRYLSSAFNTPRAVHSLYIARQRMCVCVCIFKAYAESMSVYFAENRRSGAGIERRRAESFSRLSIWFNFIIFFLYAYLCYTYNVPRKMLNISR